MSTQAILSTSASLITSDTGILRSQDLITWQRIALYLNVTVKTAQNWARLKSLPIHQFPGRRQVFAIRDELNSWLGSAESHALMGWKEISNYLGAPVRTIQLWEGKRHLPVHRFPGKRGRVFAKRDELEQWKRTAIP